MKNKIKFSKAFAFILAGILFLGVSSISPLYALPSPNVQNNEDASYSVYHGRLIDNNTHERIAYASVFVQGQNVSSISNDQGEFVIKVANNSGAKNLVISHLGYKDLVVPLDQMKNRTQNLYMTSTSIDLPQVFVKPGGAEQIMLNVIQNEKKNYASVPNQMQGFYRESIQKRRSYISLAEAVVKIYKAPYKSLSSGDQVRVLIGRMGSNVKKMDTLLFKLQGGPATALLLDVIKHPSVLLSKEMINHYHFSLENEVKIGDNQFYVIQFKPVSNIGTPLYSGTFYVNVNTYALAYAKFHMDITDPVEAAALLIQKKPMGVKVKPLSADYIAKYKEQNGKWYFNYAKGEATFKVKWRKRLFASTYTTAFEMAVTDRSSKDVTKFKPRERFKMNEIFTESMSAFANKDYWGEYNIIKPDQSIESAIKKFKRVLRREGK